MIAHFHVPHQDRRAATPIAQNSFQPLALLTSHWHPSWSASPTPVIEPTKCAIRSMFKKGMHGRTLLDVNDLVREVLTMVDVDLRNQRVSVKIDLRSDLPQPLADRGQLYQVFVNLITNAIEAMGSVTDRARVLRVSSDVIQESSDVAVTIEDSGTGIEGKNTDRIFEPFFTTKSTGTGIGLTICGSIIESHGGSLRTYANKPYGTIFQVTLPSSAL
jgi:C4-dicarboxylate-specific signal transduction histidine kinase